MAVICVNSFITVLDILRCLIYRLIYCNSLLEFSSILVCTVAFPYIGLLCCKLAISELSAYVNDVEDRRNWQMHSGAGLINLCANEVMINSA